MQKGMFVIRSKCSNAAEQSAIKTKKWLNAIKLREMTRNLFKIYQSWYLKKRVEEICFYFNLKADL